MPNKCVTKSNQFKKKYSDIFSGQVNSIILDQIRMAYYDGYNEGYKDAKEDEKLRVKETKL